MKLIAEKKLIAEENFDNEDECPSDESLVDVVVVPPSTVDEVTDEEDSDEDVIGREIPVHDVAGDMEAHVPAPEERKNKKKCRKNEVNA